MRKCLLAALVLVTVISCQKPIDWGLSSNKDGDLLIKAVEVTTATNDTNTITFQYDGQKRLTEYHSKGKVNGTPIDIKYVLSRQSDGKILRIKYTPGGFIDSVIIIPAYSGDKLAYALSTQYFAGNTTNDSTAFIYNAGGQIVEKILYMDMFGTMEETTKETYVYDAQGNPTVSTTFTTDMAGGWDLVSTMTNTFTTKKNALIMGEEAYLILEITNLAKNYISKREHNFALGIDLIYDITPQTFTTGNRPMKATIAVSPKPPGYDVKVEYFYQ